MFDAAITFIGSPEIQLLIPFLLMHHYWVPPSPVLFAIPHKK